MRYVEKHLQVGEAIIHSARLHWFIYFGPFLVMSTGVMLGVLVPETAVISVVIFLYSFIWFVGEWIIAKNSEFVITNRRMIMRTGLLKRRLSETTLAQVTGITADQGLVARILNFGTVYVHTLSGRHGPFIRIRNPADFKNAVQGQLSIAVGNQPVSSGSTSVPNVVESLERLAKLRSDGVLTDTEFEVQKAKLLD